VTSFKKKEKENDTSKQERKSQKKESQRQPKKDLEVRGFGFFWRQNLLIRFFFYSHKKRHKG